MPFSIKLLLVSVHGLTHYKVSQATFGDLPVLFLLRFLLSLLLFSFLSLAHERVHGRSRELLDRIS